MILYYKVRNSREICEASAGHASGEVCGRRCRGVQGGTEITSGIGTERLHFCIGLGQVDR